MRGSAQSRESCREGRYGLLGGKDGQCRRKMNGGRAKWRKGPVEEGPSGGRVQWRKGLVEEGSSGGRA